MSKYVVKMTCGHEEEVELFGKIKNREKEIEWLQKNWICKNCYEEGADLRKELSNLKKRFRL